MYLPELNEFASKYTTFFSKLTDPEFAADDEHLLVMQKLVLLRQMVEIGRLTEVEAQAQSADIALQSLAAKRIDSCKKYQVKNSHSIM